MNLLFPRRLVVSAVLAFALCAVAQANTGKGAAALTQAATDNKIIYLVCHRDLDAAAQAMSQEVKTFAEKNAARATWTAVAVGDPAEKAVVDRFQISRAPMPLMLAVHPNGCVTGAFQKRVTEANLTACLVSPKKAECMKQLQQNQLVLLCVQTPEQATVPQGVQDFQADPQFASRAKVLTVQLGEAGEVSLFEHLKIDPQSKTPVTVFMAPPGVLIGKFPPTATRDELGQALHKAGKCCNDPNCKHNH